MYMSWGLLVFIFFNDTSTTEIYTLSLHDALPIFDSRALRLPPRQDDPAGAGSPPAQRVHRGPSRRVPRGPGTSDRKSTRLNSSHANISYAVFCLKKKNNVTLIVSSTRTCDTDSNH